MASYYGPTDSKGYRLRLDIGAITQEINLNQSSFPWSLYLECGASYFQTFASTFNLVLDGTTVFSTTTQVVTLPGANSSVLLCSGSKVVNHNSDGTKSVSFSGSYRVNSVQSYTPQGTLMISGSFALTTIPRAALLNSFADFQIETTAGAINGNLTIYSASFNHTIDLMKNGTIVASWGIAAGPVGSYNFALALSLAQRNAIFNAMPSVESATFTLVVKTFNGGTQIGSDQSRTATGTIPATYKPVITSANSGYSWSNKNNKLVLYLIQNVSTLSLQLVGGSAPTGASLSEYKVRFGSITRQGSYNGLTISENVGLITSYGTLYAYYSVKDSRGRWSDEVIETLLGNSVNIRQYSPPVSNGFDIIRNMAAPTSADYILKFANSLYSIGNTWTYTLQYWNGSSWAQAKAATAITAASIDSIFTHALPYSESSVYSVKAILTDQFNSVEFTDDLPTSAFPLSYGSRGIGVGKDTSDTYDLEVGGGGIQSDGKIVTNVNASPSIEVVRPGSGNATIKFVNGLLAAFLGLGNVNGEIRVGSTNDVMTNGSKLLVSSDLLNLVYPVGSVYTSVLATSPATLFGGTWTRIGHGRVLVGQYDSDSRFNATEETGGAYSHDHTSAAHSHGGGGLAALINIATTGATYLAKKAFSWTGNPSTRGGTGNYTTVNGDANTTAGMIGGSTDSVTPANTGPSDNIMPYLVVYMWKRTA